LRLLLRRKLAAEKLAEEGGSEKVRHHVPFRNLGGRDIHHCGQSGIDDRSEAVFEIGQAA
jgi:hypothetical protein